MYTSEALPTFHLFLNFCQKPAVERLAG